MFFRFSQIKDPQSTIFSMDGIGAHDTISRNAMLRGLRHMERPFCHLYCNFMARYSFVCVKVARASFKGEEGEQRDAFMLALFAVGQQDALVAIQNLLRLFAPNRMATVQTTMLESLLAHNVEDQGVVLLETERSFLV